MLTPVEFGLPPKFTEWRPEQLEAIDQIVMSKERFVTVCAPTGFGKSLMYMAAAKMSGMRAVVCTSTKGLQDQLEKDFREMSQDIRGQSNYPCLQAGAFGIPGRITVDMGPCHSGAKCNSKTNGQCEYYHRYELARRADIVVTNYALWMVDRLRGEGQSLSAVKPVEMLILDEAHDAPDSLAGHLATEIMYKDVRKVGGGWPREEEIGDDHEKWKRWAGEIVEELEKKVAGMKVKIAEGRGTSTDIKEASVCQRTLRELKKVAEMRGEWVVEWKGKEDWRVRKFGPIVQFDPLWPKQYAEQILFRQVKKVVLVSATVRAKTAELLGVPAPENSFVEYSSSFPVSSRPVIHVPTVQMKWNMGEWQTLQWIQKINRLLRERVDKKGIIHTVSYQRAQLLMLNLSDEESRLLSHDSDTRATTISTFKSMPVGTVLVSPSVDTGYDFPYQECEFQIIAKIPFVDNRGKVIKRRLVTDKDYSNYVTALTIVQMTGRGMRAADDRCEVIIVDDNWVWFYRQNLKHFPQWFKDSVKWLGTGEMPEPLEKLE